EHKRGQQVLELSPSSGGFKAVSFSKNSEALALIDGDGHLQLRRLKGAESTILYRSSGQAFSPDGQHIAFLLGDNRIWIRNLRTNDAEQVLQRTDSIRHFTFSANG